LAQAQDHLLCFCWKSMTSKSAVKALVISNGVAMLFFSGPIFGWAALQLMLEAERAGKYRCDQTEQLEFGTCSEQLVHYNFCYAAASTVAALGGIFSGSVVDRCGPRVGSILAGVFVTVGALLFSTIDETEGMGMPLDGQLSQLFLGAVLISYGGNVTLFNTFRIHSLLPSPEGQATIAMYNMFYDSSSGVFLIFWLLYHNLGVSLQTLFVTYGCIATALYSCMFFLWCHVKCADTNFNFGTAATSTQESREAIESDDHLSASATKVHRISVPVADQTLSQQLCSRLFLVNTIFAVIHCVKSNVYLGSAKDLLEFYGDAGTGYIYTMVFSIVMPSSFLVSPIIARWINRFGFVMSFQAVNVMALIFGSICLIPILEAQPVAFCVYSLYRALLWGSLCAFNVRTFGPKNCGRVYGLLLFVVGIANYLQQPIVAHTHRHLGGDLRPFFFGLLVATAPLTLLIHFSRRILSGEVYTTASKAHATTTIHTPEAINKEC